MNIGSYLRFGNMLTGAYNANQQDIVNQRQQQQLENLLANSALARQIDSQNFRDQQTAIGGLGEFYRNLASGQPLSPDIAPAPMPGQDSAQQPLPPVDTAQTFPVPPRSIQAVPLPGAESVPTFGPRQQFDHISTPEQVAAAVDAKKMSPNAAASILLDMARRGGGQTPAAASQAASPAMPPAQQGQDADLPLSPGTYGRTMALIQNNQPLNLAARAAADLLKAHPNMSDRELGLTISMINPVLTKQADAVLRDARLSDTDFFKTVSLLLRKEGLDARYPGLGDGQSPYTMEQLAAGAELMRNGQPVPMGMRVWIERFFPGVARDAVTGKARQAAEVAAATAPIKTQQAIDTAAGVAPVKVQQAVDTANATAVPKANSAALRQVQGSLSAVEPAYEALHTNFAGLVQAAKKYGLGPATPINTLLNRMRSVGDPDYTTYDLFLKGVQKEFGKVLNGARSNGISVHAMKDAEKTLSGNMTLGQLEAAQKALETEGENVLKSLRQQRGSLTKQTQGGNSQQAMSAEDQQALDWAKNNPSDPRADAISRHLKEKYGL
jgi:hypothetical protein